MKRALTATILVFLAVLALALMRHAPPPPRGVDAPPDAFSAARASVVQRALAGEGASRVVGSDENARGRAAIERELKSAGWKTETQEAFSCGRHGACAFVKNVVATREGREPEAGAVLLMAHHDSVACSPGASDDGAGTAAVVEAARAIAAGPPLRRTVVAVLTDGEEAGLLGAWAFVASHPIAPKIKAAVNVDSRGGSGPSAMFETSAGNAWIVGVLAHALTRPVTSSLFSEVYRRMPNDTDFTTVKERVQGVNFANIGGIEHYHTPLDTMANADAGTLQHHGEQALAMTRALAEAGPELDAPVDRSKDAVWFDVLAFFVVRWPVSWTMSLALAALALAIGQSVRMRALPGGLGLAGSLVALASAIVASVAAGASLKALGALPAPWIAHPLPALISLHGATITAAAAGAAFVARRSTPRALWAGTWLTWSALGVIVAAVAPGASFLFVVPALTAGLAAFLPLGVASAVPACVAALIWVPLAFPLYDALGFVLPPITCVSTSILASTLPPLLAETRARRPFFAGALAVLALIVVARIVPPFSAAHPQRVNVVFRQDAPDDARVFVEASWAHASWGRAPAAMLGALGALGAQTRTEASTPWSAPAPAAKTDAIAASPPRAEILEAKSAGGQRRVRAHLASTRGARTLMLIFPSARRVDVRVMGQPAPLRDGALLLRGVGPEGLDVDVVADGAEPLDVTLLDSTPGIPAGTRAGMAGAVLAARPPEAAQTQEGDITLVGSAHHF
ncbi:MAG: M28 family peptidase [Labilithrix sp.]|nr:M28 family peptidase [Labilithrix sp.]